MIYKFFRFKFILVLKLILIVVNFIIYINYFESIVIRKYLDIEQVFDLIGEYVDGCFGGKFVD